MPQKQVTRIDLEQAGPGQVIVKKYLEGWGEGSCFTVMEFEINTSIPALLAKYESDGFAVEMAHEGVGRALRGEITRIDFIQEKDGWTVKKYPFGWTAKTRPLHTNLKPASFDLDFALAWCEKKGWTVYRWQNGARAWKGAPKPVRDSATIMSLRRKSNDSIRRGESDGRRNYDLAFYF
jgi:hypothetical protein